MQALKDAGIALVVVLLALSVRLTPLEEAGSSADVARWTPRTEAAAAAPPARAGRAVPPEPVPAEPASAAVATGGERLSILEWVVEDSAEIIREIDLEAPARCLEHAVQLHFNAEQQNDVEVEVLPCSA